MPDFGTIITVAYEEILGRPADPGGLAHYNARLNEGLSEEAMRETLLRSPEYAARFPGPGPMSPLRIVGNRFHNAAGEVKLLGMILCCDDPATPEDEALARGWPLVDEATLDLMAVHQVNYTDVRLGPSINREVWGAGEGPQFVGYAAVEDGRYDLDRWNPTFWQRVRSVIAHARSRGIYVGMSVIDFWVLDHELSPWQADRNIQGFDGGRLEVGRSAPHPIHEQWVRKVVAETGEFPNVLYQDGNESFKGAFPVWVHRLRDIVREELTSRGFGSRPFGTNSGRTEEVDHLYLHSRTAPEPGALPIIVNEYPGRSPNQVLIEAWRAYGTGVYYQYWRGEHSWADTQRVLEGLQVIVEGGNPVDFPDDCPWLVGWVPRVHNVLDGGHGQLDPPSPSRAASWCSTRRRGSRATRTTTGAVPATTSIPRPAADGLVRIRAVAVGRWWAGAPPSGCCHRGPIRATSSASVPSRLRARTPCGWRRDQTRTTPWACRSG